MREVVVVVVVVVVVDIRVCVSAGALAAGVWVGLFELEMVNAK